MSPSMVLFPSFSTRRIEANTWRVRGFFFSLFHSVVGGFFTREIVSFDIHPVIKIAVSLFYMYYRKVPMFYLKHCPITLAYPLSMAFPAHFSDMLYSTQAPLKISNEQANNPIVYVSHCHSGKLSSVPVLIIIINTPMMKSTADKILAIVFFVSIIVLMSIFSFCRRHGQRAGRPHFLSHTDRYICIFCPLRATILSKKTLSLRYSETADAKGI